jgi:hypothetical protein
VTFDEAVALAAKAHAGQTDMAGEPYLVHVLTVGLRTFDQTHSVDAAIVGILHDIVEDTDVTLSDLRLRGLTDDQLRAIDALTKREGESYQDRITRIIQEGGPFARVNKINDLEHNLDIRRMKGRRKGLTDRDKERMSDYLAAWTRLTAR